MKKDKEVDYELEEVITDDIGDGVPDAIPVVDDPEEAQSESSPPP